MMQRRIETKVGQGDSAIVREIGYRLTGDVDDISVFCPGLGRKDAELMMEFNGDCAANIGSKTEEKGNEGEGWTGDRRAVEVDETEESSIEDGKMGS